MRWTAVLVGVWAVVGIVHAEEAEPTIDDVAGERMQLLHSDDNWRIFSITVERGNTLADHATGPRAVLTLTELEILTSAADAKPLRAPAGHALWLTNSFSKGFENIGAGVLRYLVIEARDRKLDAGEASRSCGHGTPLLANSALTICWIEAGGEGARLELDEPSWLYSVDPVTGAGVERHRWLDAGVHTLPPSDVPVAVVRLHRR